MLNNTEYFTIGTLITLTWVVRPRGTGFSDSPCRAAVKKKSWPAKFRLNRRKSWPSFNPRAYSRVCGRRAHTTLYISLQVGDVESTSSIVKSASAFQGCSDSKGTEPQLMEPSSASSAPQPLETAPLDTSARSLHTLLSNHGPKHVIALVSGENARHITPELINSLFYLVCNLQL